MSIATTGSLEGLARRTLGDPLVDLGAADGPEEELFSRIAAAVRLADGRVVVGDNASRRLRIFGADGSYQGSLGAQGQGPGEFETIASIWPSPDNRLVVFDRRQLRLTSWPLDGGEPAVAAVTSGVRNPHALGRFDTGEIFIQDLVLTVPETGFAPMSVTITRHARDGSLLDTLGTWPTARMGRVGAADAGMLSGPMFEPSFYASAGADRIAITRCAVPEVRLLDAQGTVRSILRWPPGDRSVGAADIEGYRSARLDGLEPEARRRILAMLDEVPVNDVLPACEGVLVDASGRVWVRLYTRLPSPTHTWLVFGADGMPDFALELPESVRLLSATAAHVTVVAKDDLDVEHVRVYAIG